MNKSYNLMTNEWKAFRVGQRVKLDMPFSCSRYREQVTAADCKAAAKDLCRECATGARLRK